MAQKLTKRDKYLRSKYGITEAQYNELLKRQGFCCAICLRHKDEFDKHLAVEHDHVTRKIRGLACTYCNRYRIGRHRDPYILRRVADYISQDTGWVVPKKKRKRKKRK
jgi:hypothetical protein